MKRQTITTFEILIKKSAIPVRSKKAPNMIKTTINLEHTFIGVDKIPSLP